MNWFEWWENYLNKHRKSKTLFQWHTNILDWCSRIFVTCALIIFSVYKNLELFRHVHIHTKTHTIFIIIILDFILKLNQVAIVTVLDLVHCKVKFKSTKKMPYRTNGVIISKFSHKSRAMQSMNRRYLLPYLGFSDILYVDCSRQAQNNYLYQTSILLLVNPKFTYLS